MRKLAVLTDAECKTWDSAIEFYIDEGFNDHEAQEKAWGDLQTEFPRLKKFDGALP